MRPKPIRPTLNSTPEMRLERSIEEQLITAISEKPAHVARGGRLSAKPRSKVKTPVTAVAPGHLVSAKTIREELAAFADHYRQTTDYTSRYGKAYEHYVQLSQLRADSATINVAYQEADSIAEEYRQAMDTFEKQLFSHLVHFDTNEPAKPTDLDSYQLVRVP